MKQNIVMNNTGQLTIPICETTGPGIKTKLQRLTEDITLKNSLKKSGKKGYEIMEKRYTKLEKVAYQLKNKLNWIKSSNQITEEFEKGYIEAVKYVEYKAKKEREFVDKMINESSGEDQ